MTGYTILAALCLSVFIAFPLQAAVYQWTDEHGRVHFSDRPTGESATEKNLRVPPANGPSQQGIPQDRKELRRKMLEAFEQERAEKREAAEKKKEERKERKEKCREARNRFDYFSTSGSIYDYTESGERKYLNKQEREQFIADIRADVKEYCD